MDQITLGEWLMIIITFLLAIIGLLTYRATNVIVWFTGAMESHSDLMLKLEAKRGIDGKSIKLIWWDPTIAEPPTTHEHGQEVTMDVIYSCLPLKERKCRRNRFIRWMAGEPS